MPAPEARRSAPDAVDDFIRHLADCQFAIATQRIRRHFLDEYLQHAQQAVGAIDIVVGELMDPARAEAWLLDAAAGNTRTRNTWAVPMLPPYPNYDTHAAPFFFFFVGASRRTTPSPNSSVRLPL